MALSRLSTASPQTNFLPRQQRYSCSPDTYGSLISTGRKRDRSTSPKSKNIKIPCLFHPYFPAEDRSQKPSQASKHFWSNTSNNCHTLRNSPPPKWSTRRGCWTPFGGNMVCQRRAGPLTSMWRVFTQLIGKALLGQAFVVVVCSKQHAKSCSGSKLFSFPFFFFISKGHWAALSKTQWSQALCESIVLLGFCWTHGCTLWVEVRASRNLFFSWWTMALEISAQWAWTAFDRALSAMGKSHWGLDKGLHSGDGY